MRWQKASEEAPDQLITAKPSLPHQSWRAIAADELEASISLLGEMIATFEKVSKILQEMDEGLRTVNSNLEARRP